MNFTAEQIAGAIEYVEHVYDENDEPVRMWIDYKVTDAIVVELDNGQRFKLIAEEI